MSKRYMIYKICSCSGCPFFKNSNGGPPHFMNISYCMLTGYHDYNESVIFKNCILLDIDKLKLIMYKSRFIQFTDEIPFNKN